MSQSSIRSTAQEKTSISDQAIVEELEAVKQEIAEFKEAHSDCVKREAYNEKVAELFQSMENVQAQLAEVMKFKEGIEANICGPPGTSIDRLSAGELMLRKLFPINKYTPAMKHLMETSVVSLFLRNELIRIFYGPNPTHRPAATFVLYTFLETVCSRRFLVRPRIQCKFSMTTWHHCPCRLIVGNLRRQERNVWNSGKSLSPRNSGLCTKTSSPILATTSSLAMSAHVKGPRADSTMSRSRALTRHPLPSSTMQWRRRQPC